MPDRSADSACAAPPASPASPGSPAFELGKARILAMVLSGYIPLLHALTVVGCVVVPLLGHAPRWVIALAPVLLFLLPPLVVRIWLLARPLSEQRARPKSKDFLTWWITAQWQVLFNRLPFLEELVRLVPGLYSLWLRLWGSRIGHLTYWSPGCRVLDRSFLQIGDRVVLGIGVRLHPHVITREDDGRAVLLLAPVRIDDDVMVGGFSLLTAGVHVHAREVTHAALTLPPFSEWVGGRRPRAARPMTV